MSYLLINWDVNFYEMNNAKLKTEQKKPTHFLDMIAQ